MSDQDRKSSRGSELDVDDLDWDAALGEWESELAESIPPEELGRASAPPPAMGSAADTASTPTSAQAVADTKAAYEAVTGRQQKLPAAEGSKSDPRKKALYQPPTPRGAAYRPKPPSALGGKAGADATPTPLPPPGASLFSSPMPDEDDDDDDGATRMGRIPDELLALTQQVDKPPAPRNEPPLARSTAALDDDLVGPIDLDLAELEEDRTTNDDPFDGLIPLDAGEDQNLIATPMPPAGEIDALLGEVPRSPKLPSEALDTHEFEVPEDLAHGAALGTDDGLATADGLSTDHGNAGSAPRTRKSSMPPPLPRTSSMPPQAINALDSEDPDDILGLGDEDDLFADGSAPLAFDDASGAFALDEHAPDIDLHTTPGTPALEEPTDGASPPAEDEIAGPRALNDAQLDAEVDELLEFEDEPTLVFGGSTADWEALKSAGGRMALSGDTPLLEVDESLVEGGDSHEFGEDETTAYRAEMATPESEDRGAEAARRTVHRRKRRKEHYPLVGNDVSALKARASLLDALAEVSQHTARARALTASAELQEQLGRVGVAAESYRLAIEAAPEDPVPLRALRRATLAAGEVTETVDLLQKEAKLGQSKKDRASALLLLAELELSRRGDSQAARDAVQAAATLDPDSRAAALLRLEVTLSAQSDAEAYVANERLRQLWRDPPGRAALDAISGRGCESTGQLDKALTHYRAAAEAHPNQADYLLALARAGLSANQPDLAEGALAQIASLFESAKGKEPFAYAGARIASSRRKDAGAALNYLKDVSAAASHRFAADLANTLGRSEEAQAAKLAEAAVSDGTERAIALVELANLRAEASDMEGASAALADAALADSRLALVRAAREALARKMGDAGQFVATLAQGESPDSALVAAAHLLGHGLGHLSEAHHREEFGLLEKAAKEADSAVLAHVLGFDTAATLGDHAALRGHLRRQVERQTGDAKLGPLLALAEPVLRDERAMDSEVDDPAAPQVEHPLEEAVQLAGRHALALRALAFDETTGSPARRGRALIDYAELVRDGEAAWATLAAARLAQASTPDEAVTLFERAQTLCADYLAAAWAEEASLSRDRDFIRVAQLRERIADQVNASPRVRAMGWVLAARAYDAAGETDARDHAMGVALRESPSDPLLLGHVLRGEKSDAATAADALTTLGTGSDAEARHAAIMRAGAILESTEAYDEASERYRNHRSEREAPSPLLDCALDRAERLAGQYARVAERRFERTHTAETDAEKINALSLVAELDLYERDAEDAAVPSLEAIIELEPGHIPSLRALERHYMRSGDNKALARVQRLLATYVADIPGKNAHTRMCTRLSLGLPNATPDVVDALLRATFEAGGRSPFLNRHAEEAFAAAAQTKLRVAAKVASAEDAPAKHAPMLLAEALRLERGPDIDFAQLTALQSQLETDTPALSALLILADLWNSRGEALKAATVLSRAATRAHLPKHRAELFYRAALLYGQAVDDPDAAAQALEQCVEADVTFRDAFTRLADLLEQLGATERLIHLLQTRVRAGGEAETVVKLCLRLAALQIGIGDRTEAKNTLKRSLTDYPDEPALLRSLAETCLEGEDYRGAAEALIRIARVRKDRSELAWTFFQLGHIYDSHMPDAQRAEAAFTRVLKLNPTYPDALARLAALYEREGNVTKAVPALKHLAQQQDDPRERQAVRIRLALALERVGEARQAEQALESARRDAPTDFTILRAVAEFYQRQGAESAMAMHLNRAVADLRHVLADDPLQKDAWIGLVDVLTYRGRKDAGRCCAAAAMALGVQDVELGKLVDGRGHVPGAGGAAADMELEDLLSPKALPPATRNVLRIASEALEKTLPVDLRSLDATKMPRTHPLRAVVDQVSAWFHERDVAVYLANRAPNACVPLTSHPVSLLIGTEIAQRASQAEMQFLITRAMRIGASKLAAPARTSPTQLMLALTGLIRQYDPNYEGDGVAIADADEMGKRVYKALARRLREPLRVPLLEMLSAPNFTPGDLGAACGQLGSAAALLAHGGVADGLQAVLRLEGQHDWPNTGAARLTVIRRSSEAKALFDFATSEAHFEARARAGVDRT